MFDFLFSDGGFSPHGYCLAWNTPLLYTHIFADLLIAVSYFSIPAVILVFLRRRKDASLHGPAMLFVTFITACGLTHLFGVLTMFEPWYGLQGLMKVFTAVVSFVTALVLWKILPETLKIPAPGQLLRALNEKEREFEEHQRTTAELARHKLEIARKLEEVQAANNELNEFAYAASHDLKSPANTLSLWLADFKEDHYDKLEEEDRESIEEVTRIVERMRVLVEDILSYSRVVNTDLSDREMVDLQAIFEGAASDMKADIEAAGATLDIDVLPKIRGYPIMLRVLANNLLSNAIKFRSLDRPLRISISARLTSNTPCAYTLSFKDNGIGIDPAHQEQIFSLFRRLHLPEDYAGTGLGLALCRRVAVSHGGSISVNSKEGEGAEFLVTFPLEASDARKAA